MSKEPGCNPLTFPIGVLLASYFTCTFLMLFGIEGIFDVIIRDPGPHSPGNKAAALVIVLFWTAIGLCLVFLQNRKR